MGASEGNDRGEEGGITDIFLDLIDEVQASGPRATVFIVGLAFFIAAIPFSGNRTMLIGAGIVVLLLLAADILRGGTIAD